MSNYLIHYNHNHDALGRFARSAGGSVRKAGNKIGNNTTRKLDSAKRLSKKKKPGNTVEVATRQKGSKSNNTKLSEADRKRLVEHGSAKEITKYKDKLSNRELEAAITRLQKEQTNRNDLEKRLSDITNPSKKDAKSLVDKVSDAGVTLNKVGSALESGTKAYNAAAKIHNATSKDKWPIVGEKAGTSAELQRVIMTGSAAEIWANRSKMTSKEYTSATVRLGNDEKVRKAMEQEKEYSRQNTSNKSNEPKSSTTSSNYKSFYNEPPKPNIDNWSDARKQMESNANESSRSKADDILKNYPENKSGESQKMSEEEIKKKYKR